MFFFQKRNVSQRILHNITQIVEAPLLFRSNYIERSSSFETNPDLNHTFQFVRIKVNKTWSCSFFLSITTTLTVRMNPTATSRKKSRPRRFTGTTNNHHGLKHEKNISVCTQPHTLTICHTVVQKIKSIADSWSPEE